MLDFNEIIERMKDISSSYKVSGKVYDKDIASELGISQASFATMKKRGTIPYKEIMEFCAHRKISINWLFFDQPAEMLIEETGKFFRIKYFSNIRASAGGGADVLNENYDYINIDQKIMKELVGLLPNKEIEAIKVEGESMEPTLSDGSIVFIDRNQCNPRKDGVFVASTNNGLFIKRVRLRVDGMIELISDNPLYAPEILTLEQVDIVGKVVGSIKHL